MTNTDREVEKVLGAMVEGPEETKALGSMMEGPGAANTLGAVMARLEAMEEEESDLLIRKIVTGEVTIPGGGRAVKEYLIGLNMRKISSRTLFYAVNRGVLLIGAEFFRRMNELIAALEGEDGDKQDLDNPIYALILLNMYGYCRNMSECAELGCKFRLFRLFWKPELYNYGDFEPEWWQFLKDRRVSRAIRKRPCMQELMVSKIYEYGKEMNLLSRGDYREVLQMLSV